MAISQVVPYPWRNDVPIVGEYRRLLRTSGSGNVSFVSMEGYIGAKILVEGLRRAGSQPTREKLIAGLESMNKLDLGGFYVDFGPRDHNASTFVDLTMIGKNGQFFR